MERKINKLCEEKPRTPECLSPVFIIVDVKITAAALIKVDEPIRIALIYIKSVEPDGGGLPERERSSITAGRIHRRYEPIFLYQFNKIDVHFRPARNYLLSIRGYAS